MDNTTKIRELNDRFRKAPGKQKRLGKVVITNGVMAAGVDIAYGAIDLVMKFDDFTPDNDPHEEHDFGSFTYDSHKVFWKIDYYSDSTCSSGSEAPHDPKNSFRVLTVMLAEEY